MLAKSCQWGIYAAEGLAIDMILPAWNRLSGSAQQAGKLAHNRRAVCTKSSEYTNINPKYIPVLAELLIMLESEGVQIFVSTHDYFLSKYIEVKRSKDSDVQYISLYKDEDDKVQCEIAGEFELLEHNAIMDTFRQLYREEIGVVLKWKS